LVARMRLRSSTSRGIHAALIAVFAVWLVQSGVDWMWESTAVAVFALACIATAAAAGSDRVEAPRGRLPSVALMLIAACAVATQLPGLASSGKVRASERAFAQRDYVAASNRASEAIGAQPWNANAYAQRALAEEAVGRLDIAARDIETARRKEPTNWRWPLIAARIFAPPGLAR
jgi:hypothetical protein